MGRSGRLLRLGDRHRSDVLKSQLHDDHVDGAHPCGSYGDARSTPAAITDRDPNDPESHAARIRPGFTQRVVDRIPAAATRAGTSATRGIASTLGPSPVSPVRRSDGVRRGTTATPHRATTERTRRVNTQSRQQDPFGTESSYGSPFGAVSGTRLVVPRRRRYAAMIAHGRCSTSAVRCYDGSDSCHERPRTRCG